MDKEYEEWFSHIEDLFDTYDSIYLLKTEETNLSAKGFMEWIIKNKPSQYCFKREFIWSFENIMKYLFERNEDFLYYKYKISKNK